jgi:hypothetical protein
VVGTIALSLIANTVPPSWDKEGTVELLTMNERHGGPKIPPGIKVTLEVGTTPCHCPAGGLSCGLSQEMVLADVRLLLHTVKVTLWKVLLAETERST